MKNKQVQERLREGREKLVNEGVLVASVLQHEIIPKAAHEEGSYDWRYWSAGQLF
jgi:hypothetical protein